MIDKKKHRRIQVVKGPSRRVRQFLFEFHNMISEFQIIVDKLQVDEL